MQLANLVGLVAFLLACTVVGVRLVLLGARGRRRQELALGLGFLASGAVGYLLAMLPVHVAMEEATAFTVGATGLAVVNAGFVGLCYFTSSVFAGGRWPVVLGWSLPLALAASTAGQVAIGDLRDTASVWYWIGVAARTGAFLWTGGEAFRYWLAMRRRLRIGLADPVVANRFLLWALFGAAACAMSILSTALSHAMAAGGPPPDALGLAASLVGMAAAFSMLLAFFPPRAYRRLLVARAAPPGRD